jgi:hypothetical protein
MHSHTLVLAVLLFSGIQALPSTNILSAQICGHICILSSLLAPLTNTETFTFSFVTKTPWNQTDKWIPTPTSRFSLAFPTTPNHFSTTPYSNTGDSTRPFLQVRQKGTATVAEHERVRSTTELDSVSLGAVTVKRNGSIVGNGFKAGEDLGGDLAYKKERDSGTKSTRLLAREAGSFGGGGVTLPGTPRELGTVGGGNSVNPQVAGDIDIADAREINAPVIARHVVGGSSGIPPEVIGSSDFTAGSNVIT